MRLARIDEQDAMTEDDDAIRNIQAFTQLLYRDGQVDRQQLATMLRHALIGCHFKYPPCCVMAYINRGLQLQRGLDVGPAVLGKDGRVLCSQCQELLDETI